MQRSWKNRICYLYKKQCTQAIHSFGISWCKVNIDPQVVELISMKFSVVLQQLNAKCVQDNFWKIVEMWVINNFWVLLRSWTISWTASRWSKCHHYGHGNKIFKKYHLAIEKTAEDGNAMQKHAGDHRRIISFQED